MNKQFTIKPMTIEDYDGLHALWMTIQGFGIRSLDDGREDVERFICRNPETSVVAVSGGTIVGSILCGSDGRQGTLYHVCVSKEHRRLGIGRQMVGYCMKELRDMGINKVSLVAFTSVTSGNLSPIWMVIIFSSYLSIMGYRIGYTWPAQWMPAVHNTGASYNGFFI